MKVLYMDYETYWDQQHSLTKMNPVAYVMHRNTEIQSMAVAYDDGPVEILWGEDEIRAWWDDQDLSDTAVVAHNGSGFDHMISAWRFNVRPKFWLCTLAMAKPVYRSEVGGSLAKLCDYLKLGRKGNLEAIGTKGRKLASFTAAERQAMEIYNVQDVELCRKLFKHLVKQIPKREMAVIDMTIRMLVSPKIRVDTKLLKSALAEERQRKETAIEELRQLFQLDWSVQLKKMLMSNPQLADLLRSRGVEPPMKISPTTGKETYAFAKQDEGLLALLEHPDDLVRAAIETRLGVKSTILESRIETYLTMAAATGGRMPIALNYAGAHCVPGDTEVLTPSGWVQLQKWTGGDIAQVSPGTLGIRFLPAARYVGPVVDRWIRCESPGVSVDFTFGHTIPYFSDGKKQWREIQGGDLLSRAAVMLPVCGALQQTGSITADQMRVLVMVQADGNWNHRQAGRVNLRLSFKKPRKIQRCRELLTTAGIQHSEREHTDGRTTFRIPADAIPQWLSEERKVFGPWLLDSTAEARQSFVEEVVLWDGHSSPERNLYCSSVQENAEWVQIVCHLANQGVSLRMENNREWSPMYVVAVKRRNPGYTTVKRAHVSEVEGSQRAYCTQTVTGFWVARSKGKVFITGNTWRWSGGFKANQQNLPRVVPDKPKLTDALRNCLVAPTGYKIVVADLSGIELRVNHYLWQVPSSMALYGEDAEADLYKEFASRFYGIDKKDVTKAQRQFAKMVQLGLGFGMGWRKFQEGARKDGYDLDDLEARRVVTRWRQLYREIAHGWDACNHALQAIHDGDEVPIDPWGLCVTTKDGVTTPHGMLRYPKLHQEGDEWWYGEGRFRRKIYGGLLCENLVQHLARQVLVGQMLKIQKVYPISHTVHDECILVVRQYEAEHALEFMLDTMKTPPTWWPDLVLFAEGDIADSYGQAK